MLELVLQERPDDPERFGLVEESQETRPEDVDEHADQLRHEVGGTLERHGARGLGGDAVVILFPADGFLVDLGGARGLNEFEFLDQLGGEFSAAILRKIDIDDIRHRGLVSPTSVTGNNKKRNGGRRERGSVKLPTRSVAFSVPEWPRLP